VHLLQAVVDAEDAFLKTQAPGRLQSAELVVQHARPLGVALTPGLSGELREQSAGCSKVAFVIDREGVPRINHIFPLAGG
jgi:hypothetical protein